MRSSSFSILGSHKIKHPPILLSFLFAILLKFDSLDARHIWTESSTHWIRTDPQPLAIRTNTHDPNHDVNTNVHVNVHLHDPLKNTQKDSSMAVLSKPTTITPLSQCQSYPNSIPRGGSLEGSTTTSSGESKVVQKIRNIIRSLLEMGDRNSPAASDFIRKILLTIENMTGLKLLPVIKKKRRKKNKKKTTLESSSLNINIQEETKSIKSNKSTTPQALNSLNKSKHGHKKKSTTTTATATATTTTTTATTKPKPKPKSTTKSTTKNLKQTHLSRELKATNPNYRIQRELKAFLSSPPPNLKVNVGKNIRVWIITITGADNTIYEGEKYRLRVSFPPSYPTVPPSMYFLNPTPRHEHIYTNGDICLSLLGKDWRPTMTAQSLAMSILSILSSAREKSLPMDNARHAVNKPGQAQDDWVYHDDNC